VREGATNVIRHSGATRVEIMVRSGVDGIELEVSDDGRGEPAVNGTPQADGHGLAGLVERTHAVGGSVEAATGAGGGFRLRVSVPAAERAAA
jgi:two-component system sensor histidine kinase DesK